MSCRESTAFCISASQFSPVLGKGWNPTPGELAEKQHLMPSDLRPPSWILLFLWWCHMFCRVNYSPCTISKGLSLNRKGLFSTHCLFSTHLNNTETSQPLAVMMKADGLYSLAFSALKMLVTPVLWLPCISAALLMAVLNRRWNKDKPCRITPLHCPWIPNIPNSSKLDKRKIFSLGTSSGPVNLQHKSMCSS